MDWEDGVYAVIFAVYFGLFLATLYLGFIWKPPAS